MTNLLELVLPMISNIIDPSQSRFQYRSMATEAVNELGVKIATFSDWISCQGAVQPVQRSRYDALGLDWSKNYIQVWGSVVIHDLTSAKQPSQILWQGCLWNVTTLTEWNAHNGWMNCTAVQDKRYSPNASNAASGA